METPHTNAPAEPRTAAATRARMRRKQQRMADELRAAGWTCTPPDEPPAAPAGPKLTAVVRPAGPGAAGGRDSRVTVCGPAGGPAPRPRANLDGAGGYERAAFIVAGAPVPARADSEAQTRPFAELLASQGYQLVGAWVVGRDVDGRRRASIEVREVNR